MTGKEKKDLNLSVYSNLVDKLKKVADKENSIFSFDSLIEQIEIARNKSKMINDSEEISLEEKERREKQRNQLCIELNKKINDYIQSL